MPKNKQNKDWLPLIPIGIVVIMLVALVVFRNIEIDPPAPDPGETDTGQTSSTSPGGTHDGNDQSDGSSQNGDSRPNGDGSNQDGNSGPNADGSPNDGPDQNVNNDNPNADDPSSDSEQSPEELRQPPEDVQIVIEDVGIYSGVFFESGRDEPVQDVAAMLVTNKSDQYLNYCKLIYKVDGHEATFVVSGLQPGKSAWVLEDKGLVATSNSQFVYVDALTAYIDHAVRAPKELEMKFVDDKLRVKNLTDEPMENLTIYYKVVHKDGNFLGGITYALNFGTLEAGQLAEKIAGHYIEDWTQVVRVAWDKQPSGESS